MSLMFPTLLTFSAVRCHNKSEKCCSHDVPAILFCGSTKLEVPTMRSAGGCDTSLGAHSVRKQITRRGLCVLLQAICFFFFASLYALSQSGKSATCPF